jgi:exosortase
MTNDLRQNPPRRDESSLADLVSEESRSSFLESFPPATLVKIGVLALLVTLLNSWQFQGLWTKWVDDANWSHGPLIPLFSAFLLYNRRHELMAAPRRICWLGLPLFLLALVGTFLAVYPYKVRYAQNLGMIGIIFGVVLFLGGPRIIRITWLPILFLAFAMPIPDRIYNRIALPLQNLAAASARVILQIFGTEITSSHSMMSVVSVSGVRHPLAVEEACSGVRSLVAYVALGVAWAYLAERPIWQRVVVVAMAVPIAILTNILRVTITSMMFVVDKPELGMDFMHEFTGMLMLIPAFLMFWGLTRLMDALVIEEEDEPDGESQERKVSAPTVAEEGS